MSSLDHGVPNCPQPWSPQLPLAALNPKIPRLHSTPGSPGYSGPSGAQLPSAILHPGTSILLLGTSPVFDSQVPGCPPTTLDPGLPSHSTTTLDPGYLDGIALLYLPDILDLQVPVCPLPPSIPRSLTAHDPQIPQPPLIMGSPTATLNPRYSDCTPGSPGHPASSGLQLPSTAFNLQVPSFPLPSPTPMSLSHPQPPSPQLPLDSQVL